ncbi:MAG: pyruvate:ferredoxin (flavodoxin) oxidoreductase [bacterium]
MSPDVVTIDANKAAAHVAYKTNEVISIYPITPASPMGEHADSWTVEGKENIWGDVPEITEMQAEKGAAGAVHGSLQSGSLTTTFTASQGLLLMVPNMYKIAGELTPTVFHIASRSVASHALSIFCDHSDVMTARGTGWGMLFSNSVQEVMDTALIAQASTLEARVPMMHVFDGFRTSHEINKVHKLDDRTMQEMIDSERIQEHRKRGMSPEDPDVRGTAQNPDVFFQSRESVNPYYRSAPKIIQNKMDQFAELTGREYSVYDYEGSPEADRVIVMMGSGAETAQETVNHLNASGEDVGVLKIRMYRPFAGHMFLDALPETVKSISILDRTKEPGAGGEPLYKDVVTAVREADRNGASPLESSPEVVGGRYGLSSKEFTPAMVKGVFDEMDKQSPKNHFTVGINDDVTHTSIDYDPSFSTESEDTFRGVFWGLGSDGTVSANKNSIKIIGRETENYAQGYFVYDSKKAGARTVSHLRFGPDPIHSTYRIKRANFVAVHQFKFIEQYNRFNCLDRAEEGATFLLNSPYGPDEVWEEMPEAVQQEIIEKDLEMYIINANELSADIGLGNRINTIMQAAFFDISEILPEDEYVEKIKQAIRDTYGKRGETVVNKNFEAVERALESLRKVDVPDRPDSAVEMEPVVPEDSPDFVQDVTAKMIAGNGHDVPVSDLPDDGKFPSETTKWEKRNLADEVPVWDKELCIQCGKCVVVCPHATIRGKVFDFEELEGEDVPESFKHTEARFPGIDGDKRYSLQVAVEDCTGCSLCVEVCPAKDKSEAGRKAINMESQREVREQEKENWEFFESLPSVDRTEDLNFDQAKNEQLLEPLFEFSGACAGCGETPYIRTMTELFGERALIANATGCSSIYGGNLPTHPWAKNDEGRGPSWNNSLFEDNAEFGFGIQLGIQKQVSYAQQLLKELRSDIGDELVDGIIECEQDTEEEIQAQKKRVEKLRERLRSLDGKSEVQELLHLSDRLVENSVWIVGGDGWAYDIGYGGLDHVLASGQDFNVLVLDTEVYSNTGGQQSKATPQAAAAKFAMGGKPNPKKDLGARAVLNGDVYVAQVAMGADDTQTIRAIREAESYDGPSIVIAYSTCIAHGIDMSKGMEQMEKAVKSGHWPIYRYDPRRKEEGENPMQIDCSAPSMPLEEYAYSENRFRMLKKSKPERAEMLMERAQESVDRKWELYKGLETMGQREAEQLGDQSEQ